MAFWSGNKSVFQVETSARVLKVVFCVDVSLPGAGAGRNWQRSQPVFGSRGNAEPFYQRRVYLELELQDNKVTSASKMIRSMTTHFSFARRGGLAYQVDLWELRVDEVESVVATFGKGTAIACAQSFFTRKAGMSSTKLIKINQRAKQCYKAAKTLKSCSVCLSLSEEVAIL